MTEEYSAFVRSANREQTPDDEYGALAACDALTEAFGLDRYPAPPKRKRRKKAAKAAQGSGAHSSCDCTASCPA